MKRVPDKKVLLTASIVSAILLLIIPDLQVALETSPIVDSIILLFFEILLIPVLFYGFVLLGKSEKNIFLVYASYATIIWSIISAILRYGNVLQGYVVLDWLIFLIFGLALFKVKKIGLTSKITSIYITIISLIVIFSEQRMELLIGAFNWMLLLEIFFILLIITLYQYLQTMKRRRRRKK